MINNDKKNTAKIIVTTDSIFSKLAIAMNALRRYYS